jgi:hypothetical protein
VSTSIDTWARRAGVALGLMLALGAVLSWRVAAEGPALGAEARFLAVPPGELTVAPDGAFLTARRLRAGGAAASGRLRLTNITGSPVAVRMRALPSGRDLDRLLRVRVGGIFAGRLGRLRAWTRPFVMGKGGRRVLDVRVWLPASAVGAAAGAAVDVTVEFRPEQGRG